MFLSTKFFEKEKNSFFFDFTVFLYYGLCSSHCNEIEDAVIGNERERRGKSKENVTVWLSISIAVDSLPAPICSEVIQAFILILRVPLPLLSI